MGGYVAACALRAVGASSDHPRPAAFSCHYLGVARFAPVDIRVQPRKEGRSASSYRVEVEQEGRPILDGMVWSAAGDVDGLEHDETVAPPVPGPLGLPAMHELVPEEERPRYPFWGNFEAKPIEFDPVWPPPDPRPARSAAVAALPAHLDLRGPLDRRSPQSHPRGSSQLAVGPSPACVDQPPVHGPDPGPERGLPLPHLRPGVVAVRRRGAALHCRTVRLDRPGVVSRRTTPRVRGRILPLPSAPDLRAPTPGPRRPRRRAALCARWCRAPDRSGGAAPLSRESTPGWRRTRRGQSPGAGDPNPPEQRPTDPAGAPPSPPGSPVEQDGRAR